MTRPLLLLAGVLALAIPATTIDGRVFRPFAPSGPANVLLFVATDCPVSNGYAPEIQRLCAAAAASNVRCTLVYEDVGLTRQAARSHLAQFQYRGMPAAIDADASLAEGVGVTITPSVALIDQSGRVRYRGRIDNQYASLSTKRRVVTAHDLQDAVAAIVGGRPVAAAETPAVGCAIVPGNLRRSDKDSPP